MTLPDIYEFHGDWEFYVDELFDIYINEIVNNSSLRFNTLPIRTRFKPDTEDGKGYGFWHIISDGKVEEDRVPDMDRCECLPWIPYCITEAKQPPSPIHWWKNKRGSRTHIVILFEEEGFVVILGEREGYYMLVSAYFPRTKRLEGLKKERDKYWNL